jgi:hypothetical protein
MHSIGSHTAQPMTASSVLGQCIDDVRRARPNTQLAFDTAFFQISAGTAEFGA